MQRHSQKCTLLMPPDEWLLSYGDMYFHTWGPTQNRVNSPLEVELEVNHPKRAKGESTFVFFSVKSQSFLHLFKYFWILRPKIIVIFLQLNIQFTIGQAISIDAPKGVESLLFSAIEIALKTYFVMGFCRKDTAIFTLVVSSAVLFHDVSARADDVSMEVAVFPIG